MKNCDLCGKEYSPKVPHQRFCSQKCGNRYHLANHLLRIGHKRKPMQKETRQCVQCGGDFQWSSSNPSKKNCSKECSVAYGRASHPLAAVYKEETRQCVQCNGDFQWTSSRPSKKYCSDECGVEWRSLKGKEPREVKVDIPVEYDQCHIKDKHYVYGWYDGDLLFYVGKGIGDRHKLRHKRNDGTDAWCETAKQNAKNFRCLMLKTGLTERESRIVESTLITVCRPYTNVSKKSI